METLRQYLNSLSPDDQRDFAKRCRTTVGSAHLAILATRIGDNYLPDQIAKLEGAFLLPEGRANCVLEF